MTYFLKVPIFCSPYNLKVVPCFIKHIEVVRKFLYYKLNKQACRYLSIRIINIVSLDTSMLTRTQTKIKKVIIMICLVGPILQ